MTKAIEIFYIKPLYRKSSGVYVQEIDRTDLPLGFDPAVRHLVTLPKVTISANHKHPRKEAFIGIGDDLEFIWLNEDNLLQNEKMNSDGELKLFVVNPNIPHAIKNNSNSPAVILEYADRIQEDSDVTEIKLI